MIQASPTIIGLIICVGLELLFFFMHVTYWLKRPAAKIHMILAFWFFAAAVFSVSRLMQFFSDDISSGVIFGKTSALCHYTLLMLGMNFVYEYIHEQPKILEKLFWLLILSISILLIITSDIYITNQPILRQTIFGEKFYGAVGGKYFIYFGSVLPISFFIFFLKLLFAKGVPDKNMFIVIGFGCCSFFSLMDIAIVNFELNIIRFYDYAYLPLGIGYTFAMISHHSDMYNNMEMLVEKRTQQLLNVNKNLRDEIKIRVEAEKQAVLNQQRFESIYNRVNEAIFIQNEKGEIVDVNDKMLEMYGCSKTQALRMGIVDFSANVSPFTQTEIVDKVNQVLNGKDLIFEWHSKDLSDNLFWVEVYMRTAMIGDQYFIISTVRDISRRKEIDFELENYRLRLEEKVYQRTKELDDSINEQIFLNDELHKLNMELESQRNELSSALENLKLAQTKIIESEKMAALGLLIAGIAHEINNPLNYITGSIENFESIIQQMHISILEDIRKKIVESEDSVNEEKAAKISGRIDIEYHLRDLRKMLSYINTGSERITQIVKGLRLFSRTDSESRAEVDIHEHIDAVLVMLDHQIKNKITVVKEYGAIPKIKCFAGKLSQVFMNLFINAIHAIKEEGFLYISTELSDDKANLIVKIKDTGIGISEKIREKIFEPFFTTKAVGQGIGLGLSIVFSIIQQHHGTIDVKSKENEGAEFIITLPY